MADGAATLPFGSAKKLVDPDENLAWILLCQALNGSTNKVQHANWRGSRRVKRGKRQWSSARGERRWKGDPSVRPSVTHGSDRIP